MFALLMHVHVLFVITALSGALLFLIWAVKYLKADRLEHLSFYLLGIGIIGTLITAQWSMAGMMSKQGFQKHFGNNAPMYRMMESKQWETKKIPTLKQENINKATLEEVEETKEIPTRSE